jgi:hypothetical protein
MGDGLMEDVVRAGSIWLTLRNGRRVAASRYRILLSGVRISVLHLTSLTLTTV